MAKVICKVCGAEMDLPNHEAMCIGAFNDKTDNVIGILPTRKPNENGGKRTMEMVSKVEALKSAGFSESDIQKMIGIIGFNKDEVIKSDDIGNIILNNRGAKNDVSFRRWITSQFLKAHFNYDGGVQEYINSKNYNWQFEMMIEECKQLAKMENNGDKEFEIRSKFFTLDVIRDTLIHYRKNLQEFLITKMNKDDKKCKGIPYVKYTGFKGKGFYKNCCFGSDILDKCVFPTNSYIYRLNTCKTYEEAYTILREFIKSKHFIPLPYTTRKCDSFIDAFKGAGAYYSMMNLSQFSDLKITDYSTHNELNKSEAKEYLKDLVRKNTDGYKLYGQFKEMIKYNKFSMNKFEKICAKTRKNRLEK